MIQARAFDFPKVARLRKSADFRFRRFRRFQADGFVFIFSDEGTGRLGISISKKVLRRANQRNRVKRLLREAFRLQRAKFSAFDIHAIGREPLNVSWETLRRQDIEKVFDRFSQTVCRQMLVSDRGN